MCAGGMVPWEDSPTHPAQLYLGSREEGRGGYPRLERCEEVERGFKGALSVSWKKER